MHKVALSLAALTKGTGSTSEVENFTRREGVKYLLSTALTTVSAAAALVASKAPAHAGWGRCTANDGCQAFGGMGENCTNCGHPFGWHG
jgi:hypothetical protein